ncbi:MAG: hypothetical protein LBB52_00375, partial [Desulfovibrio sp.]|nr:hypothetical protein [Desulfovibrio sp.]
DVLSRIPFPDENYHNFHVEMEVFGFQIQCPTIFGEPRAGKARLLPAKTFGACGAGAIPVPDNLRQFIWN